MGHFWDLLFQLMKHVTNTLHAVFIFLFGIINYPSRRYISFKMLIFGCVDNQTIQYHEFSLLKSTRALIPSSICIVYFQLNTGLNLINIVIIATVTLFTFFSFVIFSYFFYPFFSPILWYPIGICSLVPSLQQLCATPWVSRSRPAATEPGLEPASLVAQLALRCSALGSPEWRSGLLTF
jgi:hypothetical protein